MTPIIPGIKDFPELRLKYDAEMNNVKSSNFNGCSSCQKIKSTWRLRRNTFGWLKKLKLVITTQNQAKLKTLIIKL